MQNIQTELRRLLVSVALLVLSAFIAKPILAQERAERTIEEIKVEALKRAQNGMYPMIGLDPADVEDAFTSIKTRDKDEWATAFMHVADRYMAEGKSLEKSDPAKANADFLYDEITTIDNALTRPWTVIKKYRRYRDFIWVENNCAEGNAHVGIGKENYMLSADGLLMPARKNQAPPDLRYFQQIQR